MRLWRSAPPNASRSYPGGRCRRDGRESFGRSTRASKRAEAVPHPPDYLLLTDADIVYAPDALTRLVARAQSGGYVLTSLMAKLRCESFAERMFIPAFIFFFQMLYPFAWANNPRRTTAAAAGGCMLVRREALAEAGGMAAIRSALIDDCALAKKLKAHGPIWIGLTDRRAAAPAPIRRWRISATWSRAPPMRNFAIRRSCLREPSLGLAITYLAPVCWRFSPTGAARLLGIAAWLLMALAFQPTLRFYRVSPLWGLALPAIAATYMAFTVDSAYQHARGRGGMWKGRAQANVKQVEQRFGIAMNDASMSDAGDWRSGKGHRDENFPVASFLIHPRHRAGNSGVLQFCAHRRRYCRSCDASAGGEARLLDRLEAGLVGDNDDDAAAVRLRDALAARTLSPRHAQDLLAAFKLDVTKLRYRDWDDLIGYCSLSAMPVGRFVLDVHGESRSTWPANDALCAALQIINHLQDCKDDYRNLDRVYVPLDTLAACGVGVEALGEPQASPALLAALHGLAERTERLLAESDVFPLLINDRRLALEVSVINTLAHRLTRMLMVARSVERSRASFHARRRRSDAPRHCWRRDPGGSAGGLPPRHKSRGVRE